GLPVGTDRVQLALQALGVAGLESRDDFRATLACCFIARAEQREMFDQAFDLFWRNPDITGRMMAMMLPRVAAQQGRLAPAAAAENGGLAQAMFPEQARRHDDEDEPPEQIEIDATLTFSEREILRGIDFETMSADEWQQAKRALRSLRLAFEPL